jgi:hypothetical protein
MKNNLWILLISVVTTLSSCITAAQFNNAEDDVYYSPKASNQKAPVMIPEVDVDEIIKQHPPQYGEPTNQLNQYDNTNPAAAQYYPAYRAYRDSVDEQNQRYSASYIDPDLSSESETQEAERLRRMYGGNNSGNWNVGLGWSWWGPTLSVGYGNYNNGFYGYNGWNTGYYGYNNFYSPYYGYGYGNGCGFGYNGFYNPYYSGYGYGYGYNNWCSPWYGGGYYNPWCGGGYYNNNYGYGNYGYGNNGYHNDNGGNNSGNQPISRPRQAVGGNTPPATGDTRSGTNSGTRSGMYVAPAQPNQEAQPAQGTRQNATRSNSTYTPSAPQQQLENVNGRQVYTRPATPPPAQQNTSTTPTYQSPTRSQNTRSTGNSGTTNPNTQPTYSRPNTTTTPSNGTRSSGGSSGTRSGGGGSSGGSSSGGGRRR